MSKFESIFDNLFNEFLVTASPKSYYPKEWHSNDYVNDETRYYKDGILHRLDGPAIVRKEGENEYYIDGRYYEKEDFKNYVEKLEENKKYTYVIKLTKSEKEKVEKLLDIKLS